MPVKGVVASLWRYPVKSMQGERVSRAWLSPAGITGDRRWALIESSSGRVLSAKRHAALMTCRASLDGEDGAVMRLGDGPPLRCVDVGADSAVTAFLGFPARVEDAEGLHFDARPIHLLTTASLNELARRAPSCAFDPRRFRPNIVIDIGEPGGFPELSWRGESRVGQAVLRLDKPTKRCVMTTHPQAELPQDRGVLQAAVDATGGDLGIYAYVQTPGWISEGDAFDLIS